MSVTVGRPARLLAVVWLWTGCDPQGQRIAPARVSAKVAEKLAAM